MILAEKILNRTGILWPVAGVLSVLIDLGFQLFYREKNR